MATVKEVKNRRQLKGLVISDKMAKTAVVRVTEIKMHPKYRKQFKIGKNYKVHDEKKQAQIGDIVIFEECRPLSKDKRWRLISILKK